MTVYQPPLPGMDAPPASTRGVLWHYTSVNSLEAIVGSSIWRASSVRDMNDLDELRLGQRRLRRAVREMRAARGEFVGDLEDVVEAAVENVFETGGFGISFSRDGDDNSQWERYAGTDGVAIGVNRWHFPMLFDRTGQFSSAVDTNLMDYPLHWMTMRYTKRNQLQIARERLAAAADLMERADSDSVSFSMWQRANVSAGFALSELIISCKNRGFRSEREIRYVVGAPWDRTLIKDGPGGRRFVEVTGGAERAGHPSGSPQHSTRFTSPLPIAFVRTGPACTTRTRQYVCALLYRDYPQTAVLPSKSTLRVTTR
ncbi:DUF2971 domain-containing protein [Mycetocola zhadangensis]|uniref:DUF2971 domain-containing protein n=1 Tax=Mycetocola zhadangensis TaxID=1164595 RepID=UPI0011C3AC46|nr:DUF2971 domain-containing protein [Mycetocola zhadangensis]